MNFFKRVLVAIISIPILLYIFFKGGYLLAGFLLILSVLGSFEFTGLLEKQGIQLPFKLFIAATTAFLINSYIPGIWIDGYIFLLFFLSMAYYTFRNELSVALTRTGYLLAGVLYVGISLSYFVKLHDIPNGAWLLVLQVILIWVTDTFAYFTGMLFGKHKGIIKASPKKSLEGFVGGAVWAVVFGIVSSTLFSEHLQLPQVLICSFSAGFFGQIGDLIESAMKRAANVKDSSNLIPGHGGILDRFDSSFIVIPVTYFLLNIYEVLC